MSILVHPGMNIRPSATQNYFLFQFANANTPDKPINICTIFSNPAIEPKTICTTSRLRRPTNPQLSAPTRTRTSDVHLTQHFIMRNLGDVGGSIADMGVRGKVDDFPGCAGSTSLAYCCDLWRYIA